MTYQIPEDVVDMVTSALNVALSLSLMHAPTVHPSIMEAAIALDDAVNGRVGE